MAVAPLNLLLVEWEGASAARTLAHPQSRRPRQLRLPLIEGPESPRTQLQGRSHVQSVKCCHPDASCLLPRQLDAAFKRHFRQTHLNPKASLAIAFKAVINCLRLADRDIALKKTSSDGVRPFRTMKRREPNTRMPSQQTAGFCGVLVGDVQRDEKTRICVNAQ